ncbi:protein of unknown function (plasmid) [Cupriavidus taiwanensis]|uniref:Uncharacterized protein n=1 Tax=Cupriavidus taiwanensis TaxID=164546 RepID=A0A375FHE5_9BURK|nr:protein of unknown function [Cupriavidus taiwanensis]SOZ72365.1 protein of unknown function [Cupriavidus taiwanensis]SOZ74686.1 protein of unknown function [Cupriavidus taiwanensis]SPA03570.1 protein of unknown function [Cupriavidus taiwanensis]SPA11469.1 protein of unknown function [Cupriavidus taiwanensis]
MKKFGIRKAFEFWEDGLISCEFADADMRLFNGFVSDSPLAELALACP